MQAIAEAMAIAVTGVSADCFIVGDNAYACAMGKADITKTATVRPLPAVESHTPPMIQSVLSYPTRLHR